MKPSKFEKEMQKKGNTTLHTHTITQNLTISTGYISHEIPEIKKLNSFFE